MQIVTRDQPVRQRTIRVYVSAVELGLDPLLIGQAAQIHLVSQHMSAERLEGCTHAEFLGLKVEVLHLARDAGSVEPSAIPAEQGVEDVVPVRWSYNPTRAWNRELESG